MTMTRSGSVLRWVLAAGVLSGAVGSCAVDPPIEAVNAPDVERQIQGELDAAEQANPSTFARVRPLRPVLKCVENLDGSHFRAHFGYSNASATTIPVGVGFMNRFWPPPSDRGQPTSFAAGSQADVIQVGFNRFGASIWVLGSHLAVATRFSKPCPAGGTGGSGAGGTGIGGSGLGGSGAGGSGTGGVAGAGGEGGGPTGCPASCDDHDPCTIDLCGPSTGFQCASFPALDTTPCDDGDPCTLADACRSGQCVPGLPKVCNPVDDCHLAGVCDVATGVCSNPVGADDSPCSPRDACNVSGHCAGGVCIRPPGACDPACDQCTFGPPPGGPDVCSTTPDGCYNCFPPTDGCGSISDPGDRSLCENLYACLVAPTHPGTSVPGPCVMNGDPLACWCGTNPATCTTDNVPPTRANGPCLAQILAAAKTTEAAVVNQRLLNPSFPIGHAINLAACQSNYCALECHLPLPTAPCAPLDFCHVAGLRDPVTGVCSDPPARDGTSCSDGILCTVGDQCQAGVCVGGPVCPAPDQCHSAGTCSATTGTCASVAKPDGTACTFSGDCPGMALCTAGNCLPTAASSCDVCEQCTFGVPPGQADLCSATPEGCLNCDRSTDGCQDIADAADRASCQNLYACLVAPTHPGSMVPGACITMGDPLACWCGTRPMTCTSSNDPATQANGPCLTEIFAAAKSTDAAVINLRLINPSYPVGRAMNLAICRGNYCPQACSIPF